MSFGICDLVQIPVRAEPRDASEMTTQLLFGEAFEILETADKWLRIRCLHDGYEGWIDHKQYLPASPEMVAQVQQSTAFCLDVVAAIWRHNARRFVVLGSPLPALENNNISIGPHQWEFEGEFTDFSLGTVVCLRKLVNVGLRYLDAPYLWGGRSPFGIDCSGLTQMVMRLCKVSLPRDAWQQASVGEEVLFENAEPGDLAFFHNDKGRVSHVGILFPDNQILHASGRVRLDGFSKEGIVRQDGTRSHNLHSIKRVVVFEC